MLKSKYFQALCHWLKELKAINGINYCFFLSLLLMQISCSEQTLETPIVPESQVAETTTSSQESLKKEPISLIEEPQPVINEKQRETAEREITPTFKLLKFWGNNEPRFKDGKALEAYFQIPDTLIQDKKGNIYISDTLNQRIRKIDTDGNVITVAGNGNDEIESGVATEVGIGMPEAIAIDSKNNIYFVSFYNTISKLSTDGIVSHFAGGSLKGYKDGDLNNAEFSGIAGIVIDKNDNIYVADKGNNVIRKISPKGIVSTFAGTGKRKNTDSYRTKASFNVPCALALNSKEELFVSQIGDYRIRKIDLNGQVSTFIGNGESGSRNGMGTEAQVGNVFYFDFDKNDNLYFSDQNIQAIRKVTKEGQVTTLIKYPALNSKNILDTHGSFGFGIEIGNNDEIFFIDNWHSHIKQVIGNSELVTIAGKSYKGQDGGVSEAIIPGITGFDVDSQGQIIVSTIAGIRTINLQNNASTIKNFDPINQELFVHLPRSVSINSEDEAIIADSIGNSILKIKNNSSIVKLYDKLVKPIKAIEDHFGNLYILEQNRHHILRLSRNNVLTKFAGKTNLSGNTLGNIYKDEVLFNHPRDIAFDQNGNLLVLDSKNGLIKSIDRNGNVTPLHEYKKTWGSDQFTPFYFEEPTSFCVDNDNAIYVADQENFYYLSKDRYLFKVDLSKSFPNMKENFSNSYKLYNHVSVDGNNNLYINVNSTLSRSCFTGEGICVSTETEFSEFTDSSYIFKMEVQKGIIKN